jgi:hypothetical protein
VLYEFYGETSFLRMTSFLNLKHSASMKSFLPASLLLAAALLGLPARADILVSYDFNQLATVNSPNTPSCVSPCIEASDLVACGLTSGLHSAGGFDGSAFRTFSGWDQTQYDPTVYFNRADLFQWPQTVSFTFETAADTVGSFTGFSVDVKRPYSYSPDSLMASIFWEDSNGTVQQRNSGPLDIGGATTWTNVSFLDTFGTASLPSGLDFGGETFRIELYAWGGSGGALYLDNVNLMGDCAPIPEPSTALLLAIAGLVLVTRRRMR